MRTSIGMALRAGIGAGMLLGALPALALNNSVTLSTHIDQGTCTFHFEQNGKTVSDLPLGTFASVALDSNNSLSGVTQVDVVLDSCGLGSTGAAKPSVQITQGQALVADVPGASKYTFRDAGEQAGNTSKGYFVFIAGSATPAWPPTGNADFYGQGDVIPVAAGGASGAGARKSLWLGVGCGQNCTGSATLAGSLLAHPVFTFLYQ
ncbi:hypothetical protein D3C81_1600770 [compost metagenome]